MITEFDDISVKLNAENIGEDFQLSISRQVLDGDEEFFFALYGTKKGERLQYDFNGLSRKELEEINIAISMMLEIK